MNEAKAILALLAIVIGATALIAYVLPPFWPLALSVGLAYHLGRRCKGHKRKLDTATEIIECLRTRVWVVDDKPETDGISW